ncbi:discoidin, CUB and LCCL domain-containing protein 2 [Synchiropus splendidus]|uniref:discoidin, CUB and LCCL domain-containing protein 2 n=1 Tax=Synchiropus splendidus TaxID=270530 RepID=UPI00237D9162|nr:discoidin, CUB and LCCL domain-containing protein 2 [Synchiropus splendidus]
MARVMVGRGPTEAAGVLVLSILLILTAGKCRAQKGDGCGPTVLGPSSGTLSSLGYPGTYPNNSVCVWEISVPRGKRIHFRFAELDIEDSDCQVNYLRLYNGIGPERSEIVKYCGLNLKVKDTHESSGNQVTVQFMSGNHRTGRGFYLSYSTSEHSDLITCLDKGSDFPMEEFSKYCPAGCLTSTEEISGTTPKGYRESSPLCVAAVHAGVVSNAVGGRISVVTSKGIDSYSGTLANNVTSTGGTLSNSLFTFKTNGCYGKLGLESGVVADTQLSASSVWEWNVGGRQSAWSPSGARLEREGLPWSPAQSDQHQWLQVDLKREKRVTGITTSGSIMREFPYYVSAYRVLHSRDGQQWLTYKEANSTHDMVFQGNRNYLDQVRNNFIPPIQARYIRVSPTLWHQRIAIKLELLGCQIHSVGWLPEPRMHPPPHGPRPSKQPPRPRQTTHTPDIRNTTMPPQTSNDVALAAVLVPVLAMVLTAAILVMVGAWHWRSRKKSSEGTYDLPHWDRTDWWKSMKQLLPSKMVETEDSVRYSSSEVGRLAARGAVPRLHAEPAEYAQPLVSGVTTLGARSTFKPDEGPDPGYTDPDLYDAPISPDVYHAYAEPLPASGAEYATPIVVDMNCHPSALLARTDGGAQSGASAYDTPKVAPGPAAEDQTYQVPQCQKTAS